VAPESADELAALLADVDVPAEGVPAATVSERRNGGWELSLPLPFAERADVDLTRWNDDLVVTAGGTRRSLQLDALLRRCDVTGGRLADPGLPTARLEVVFRPDPQLWPADLLAAEERTP
jgi:arsenite-transporting ATPase